MERGYIARLHRYCPGTEFVLEHFDHHALRIPSSSQGGSFFSLINLWRGTLLYLFLSLADTSTDPVALIEKMTFPVFALQELSRRALVRLARTTSKS